jgi:hypothetical protein
MITVIIFTNVRLCGKNSKTIEYMNHPYLM